MIAPHSAQGATHSQRPFLLLPSVHYTVVVLWRDTSVSSILESWSELAHFDWTSAMPSDNMSTKGISAAAPTVASPVTTRPSLTSPATSLDSYQTSAAAAAQSYLANHPNLGLLTAAYFKVCLSHGIVYHYTPGLYMNIFTLPTFFYTGYPMDVCNLETL